VYVGDLCPLLFMGLLAAAVDDDDGDVNVVVVVVDDDDDDDDDDENGVRCLEEEEVDGDEDIPRLAADITQH